jgi:predicted pyridoxine 5'-phosphate oxidase superfamily flavin-nucleotide-binding protein
MGAYHEGELEVQRRAGVAANAERIARSIHREIPELARQFAEERRFAIIGAADEAGRLWATLVQGAPGFLSVPSPDRLHVAARPDRGDPLAGALAAPADVGMLLIEPASRRRMRLNGRAYPRGDGLDIETREVYANCPKYIRPRAVALPAPGHRIDRCRSNTLTASQARWLAETDTLFIATRHVTAGADVSHRGGEPGFVQVPDPSHVLIPDYPGNMMFNTLGNIASDGRAGLVLVNFAIGRMLQLTGRSAISWDADLVAGFPGAARVVTFAIEAVEESAPGEGVRCLPDQPA